LRALHLSAGLWIAALGLAWPVTVHAGVGAETSAGDLDGPAATFRAHLPAALAGDATAAYAIGAAYAEGARRREDLIEAARWYLKAAQAGHPRAQNELGLLLAKGRGVAQDYVRAYALFDLAAAGFERGWRYEQAIELRDMMAAFMSPSQRRLAERLAAKWKAEAAGTPPTP